MSARIVNTIAEAIDDGPDPVTQVTELSKTILDALRANGFEVVELPKPDENDEFRDALGCIIKPTVAHEVWDSGSETMLYPHEARAQATALLAAANAAEATR